MTKTVCGVMFDKLNYHADSKYASTEKSVKRLALFLLLKKEEKMSFIKNICRDLAREIVLSHHCLNAKSACCCRQKVWKPRVSLTKVHLELRPWANNYLSFSPGAT